MREVPFFKLIRRLETAAALDPVIRRVKGVVNGAIRPQWLRDTLNGVWVGHPVHPIAVQVPVGAWMSAGILDLLPHTQPGARMLVGVGVVSAIPTALAGYTDGARLHERQLRVGIVHSAASLVATGLYAASFLQRARGRHAARR